MKGGEILIRRIKERLDEQGIQSNDKTILEELHEMDRSTIQSILLYD